MTFRLVRRAHRHVVQKRVTELVPSIGTNSSYEVTKWKPVLLGRHRSRLLAKLHLLLLREFNRQSK